MGEETEALRRKTRGGLFLHERNPCFVRQRTQAAKKFTRFLDPGPETPGDSCKQASHVWGEEEIALICVRLRMVWDR